MGDRNSWLLAIVRQAALAKERVLLLQAERIISGMEFRRSSAQLAKLDALHHLSGVLAAKETRELFLDFARTEHQDMSKREPDQLGKSWPAVSIDSLIGHLERCASGRA